VKNKQRNLKCLLKIGKNGKNAGKLTKLFTNFGKIKTNYAKFYKKEHICLVCSRQKEITSNQKCTVAYNMKYSANGY
jgi:hypothetical protein